ncbi:AtpZ/AtpI family protein [Actinomadura scrupuli]|jgi:F0F1-type ATP synthase assembly protein I|uniref:AtpZ/AtpI family protein n=1 Tax=Actinomadura scrupuli TaxID=559629 RepID=UPI003D95D6EF
MVRSAKYEDGRWPDEAENRAFSNAASAAPATILAGMLVYGGVGWLLSRWLHVPALLPIGLVLGLVFAFYLVYVRYGR